MNKKIVLLLLCSGLTFGFLVGRYYENVKLQSLSLLPIKPVEEKIAQGVLAKGFYRDGTTYRIILSDGRTITADSFKDTPTGWQAKAGEFWYKGEKQ